MMTKQEAWKEVAKRLQSFIDSGIAICDGICTEVDDLDFEEEISHNTKDDMDYEIELLMKIKGYDGYLFPRTCINERIIVCNLLAEDKFSEAEAFVKQYHNKQ